jgi:Flp pilus assembly protein TadD
MFNLSAKTARAAELRNHSFVLTVIALSGFLLVAGCSPSKNHIVGKSIDSMSGLKEAREERLATAAADSIAEGKAEEALVYYAQLYTGNSRKQDIALNYAQLLRKTGNPQRALTVLSGLMVEVDGTVVKPLDPIIRNEYAACSIELGKFKEAKKSLTAVLENKRAKRFHADASNLMGVLLDAQGRHDEAEGYFRTALEGWHGDETSVMNNLALNLAEQGKFDESLNLLRRALVMAPQKQEISRNIDFVSDLRKSIIPAAPVGHKKSGLKKKK